MTKVEKLFVNRGKKAERNLRRVQQALQYVDISKIHDVLEIGCGIGIVSSFLADNYGLHVRAIDSDMKQIDLAHCLRNNSDLLSFSVEDATDMRFADASFDLLLSQNVFHHIPNWQKSILEITRVLRPYGYVIWLDLALPPWLKKTLRPFGNRVGLYTLDDVQTAFEENRLHRLFYQRFVHGPFIHHHMVLQKSSIVMNEFSRKT